MKKITNLLLAGILMLKLLVVPVSADASKPTVQKWDFANYVVGADISELKLSLKGNTDDKYYTSKLEIAAENNTNVLKWTNVNINSDLDAWRIEESKNHRPNQTLRVPSTQKLDFANGPITVEATVKRPTSNAAILVVGTVDGTETVDGETGITNYSDTDAPRFAGKRVDSVTNSLGITYADATSKYYTYRIIMDSATYEENGKVYRNYDVYYKEVSKNVWSGPYYGKTSVILDCVTGLNFTTSLASTYTGLTNSSILDHSIKDIKLSQQKPTYEGKGHIFDFTKYVVGADISGLNTAMFTTSYDVYFTSDLKIAKDGADNVLSWTNVNINSKFAADRENNSNISPVQQLNLPLPQVIDFSNGPVTIEATLKQPKCFNSIYVMGRTSNGVETTDTNTGLIKYSHTDGPRVANTGNNLSISYADATSKYYTYKFVIASDTYMKENVEYRKYKVYAKEAGSDAWHIEKESETNIILDNITALNFRTNIGNTALTNDTVLEYNIKNISVTQGMKLESVSAKDGGYFTGNVEFVYNETLDTTSVNAETVKVSKGGTALVFGTEYTAVVDGKKLTVNVVNAENDAEYDIEIGDIKSTLGLAPLEDNSLTLKTSTFGAKGNILDFTKYDANEDLSGLNLRTKESANKELHTYEIKITKDGADSVLKWTNVNINEALEEYKKNSSDTTIQTTWYPNQTLIIPFPQAMDFKNGAITIETTLKMPKAGARILPVGTVDGVDAYHDWSGVYSNVGNGVLYDGGSDNRVGITLTEASSGYYTYKFVIYPEVFDSSYRKYDVYVKAENSDRWIQRNESRTWNILHEDITGIAFKTNLGSTFDGATADTILEYDIKNISVTQGMKLESVSAKDGGYFTGDVEFVYNEMLDTTSVNAETVKVSKGGTALVFGTDYTVAANGTKLTVSVVNPENDTEYDIEIGDIKSTSGLLPLENKNLNVRTTTFGVNGNAWELSEQLTETELNALGVTTSTVGKVDSSISSGIENGYNVIEWSTKNYAVLGNKAHLDFELPQVIDFANGPVTIELTAKMGGRKVYGFTKLIGANAEGTAVEAANVGINQYADNDKIRLLAIDGDNGVKLADGTYLATATAAEDYYVYKYVIDASDNTFRFFIKKDGDDNFFEPFAGTTLSTGELPTTLTSLRCSTQEAYTAAADATDEWKNAQLAEESIVRIKNLTVKQGIELVSTTPSAEDGLNGKTITLEFDNNINADLVTADSLKLTKDSIELSQGTDYTVSVEGKKITLTIANVNVASQYEVLLSKDMKLLDDYKITFASKADVLDAVETKLLEMPEDLGEDDAVYLFELAKMIKELEDLGADLSGLTNYDKYCQNYDLVAEVESATASFADDKLVITLGFDYPVSLAYFDNIKYYEGRKLADAEVVKVTNESDEIIGATVTAKNDVKDAQYVQVSVKTGCIGQFTKSFNVPTAVIVKNLTITNNADAEVEALSDITDGTAKVTVVAENNAYDTVSGVIIIAIRDESGLIKGVSKSDTVTLAKSESKDVTVTFTNIPENAVNYCIDTYFWEDLKSSLKPLVKNQSYQKTYGLDNVSDTTKDIKVAAIGGSITEGGRIITPFLEKWDADREGSIEFVNAGIGGTQSNYGSLRLADDVLAYNPDVVFVEFVINDEGDMTSAYNVENIIRQIYAQEHQPVVIFVYNPDRRDVNGWYKVEQQIGFYNSVLSYYGLTALDVHNLALDTVVNGAATWDDYVPSDNVHCTVEQGATTAEIKYAEFKENIGTYVKNIAWNETKYNNTRDDIENGRRVSSALASYDVNWNETTVDNVVTEGYGLPSSMSFENYMATTVSGSKYSFDFSGSKIILTTLMSNNGRSASYVIKNADGEIEKRGTMSNYYAGSSNWFENIALIEMDLADCDHTIEITVDEDSNTTSVFGIGDILIDEK